MRIMIILVGEDGPYFREEGGRGIIDGWEGRGVDG